MSSYRPGDIPYDVLEYNGSSCPGTIPAILSELSNLHTLTLAENSLTGTLPLGLSALTKLRVFHADGNDLTGEGVALTSWCVAPLNAVLRLKASFRNTFVLRCSTKC